MPTKIFFAGAEPLVVAHDPDFVKSVLGQGFAELDRVHGRDGNVRVVVNASTVAYLEEVEPTGAPLVRHM